MAILTLGYHALGYHCRCALTVSDDDIVRAYASEALLSFTTEKTCVRAFVEEGGLTCALSLIHHAIVVGGVHMDHLQQTADDAIMSLVSQDQVTFFVFWTLLGIIFLSSIIIFKDQVT